MIRENIHKLNRQITALRYYRKTQIARRVFNRCRNFIYHSPRFPRQTPATREIHLPTDYIERKLSAAKLQFESKIDLSRGVFTFLNQTESVGNPIDWNLAASSQLPHLWRFHFNYHEFLLQAINDDAKSSGHDNHFQSIWHFIGEWISHNRLPSKQNINDAWHPFCISRRIPIWCLIWQLGKDSCPDSEKFLESLSRQAHFLSSRLERDIGGNHLLENAKALAIAGSFFSGKLAERWLRQATQIFEQELKTQILPHGEHFERSPMYHAISLELLLDVQDCCRETAPQLSSHCSETAKRMTKFLREILHPDGEIPLFGDSVFEPARPVTSCLDFKGLMDGASAETIGDYWIWRHKGDFLIFDAGPVGSEHLPAHAHADLLTFEGSMAGQRLFVDSGTFNYEDDEMRRYCRSSAAHNVSVIDDQDHCEMWSKFRMGFRGRPTSFQSGKSNNRNWVHATHNAYHKLGVPILGRWICAEADKWLIVDWAIGSGTHTLSTRLHLHPDVTPQQIDETTVKLCFGKQLEVFVKKLGPGELAIDSGWYCPEFGVRFRTHVLRASCKGALPQFAGWEISRKRTNPNVAITLNNEALIVSENSNSWTIPYYSTKRKY